VLLHTIGAGILGGVNGWEGALKGAAGAATSALLTPAIADLVKGMLKDSTLSDQDKRTLAAAIGSSLSGLAGAIGGGEGASYGVAQYQYNYLDHADNDALNAAKAACKSGDDDACKEKARLEAKDKQQQLEFISCRASNFSGAGCYGVALNVLAAVSSYAGGISYWKSLEEKTAAVDKLVADGSIEQLWKLRAPENYDNLTPAQIQSMRGDLAYILADPFFVNNLPATVKEALDGDPVSALQAIALLTRFNIFGKGIVKELTETEQPKNGTPTNGGQTGAGGFWSSADEAYESIRSSTSDVDDIARNTGLKPENIQKVKDHLFLNEHTLDRYVDLGIPAEKARFDSDIKIAESWHRLEVGKYTDDDIQLLRHEIAERWVEIKRDCGYCEAHDAASINFPAPDWWK